VHFDSGDGRTEARGFLEDGDAVVFAGWCERPGFARVGFGECRGTCLCETYLQGANQLILFNQR